MEKTEVVFVPIYGVGHLFSSVELAKRLIHRDDRLSITVLCMRPPSFYGVDPYVESLAASNPSIRFIGLPQVDPPSPEVYNGPEGFISLFVESYKPHVRHALTQLMSPGSGAHTVRVAGMVIDLFCTSMIDVANEFGIPSYLFFTSGAGLLGLMLHLPTLDTQIPTGTELKDAETELKFPNFVNPVPPFSLPKPLWNRKEHGYTWFVYHGRRFKEVKGIIINTFAEFESHAVNSLSDGQTPAIYPVGPLVQLEGLSHSLSDHTRTQYSEIMKWLDDQPPSSVVLLCFGSMGGFDEAQVKEIAIGLERSGYRFLWSLRQARVGMPMPNAYPNPKEVLPDGFLERTEGRGFICGWVPQVKVLAHPAIGGFVSHCGWNSTLESLWYGVPLATWPLYAEQHLNAFQLVKELGLAVELRLEYRNGVDLASAEEVERGMRSLMAADSEVRTRVREMGEKSRAVLVEGGSSFVSLGRLIEDLMHNN
ncbi:PREDICTED: anthocyanidin 3-O-glucosyltransferase 2-like [Nelumbo nucifera]|uniref:Glycosyltransferase n=1 Tax=Nelumbo nucifera TaxID=4432 RepID=A0A1U8A168_NELNU|nr:PREDICTED: anthocyanidin 3-O-glucosyltransferase 2-like [Nelumbo nucifera]XP_010260711.1 PREDICTED: anthocyanidin 3-O-glucosyltransferase 2-like [Nelumbo nucifera]